MKINPVDVRFSPQSRHRLSALGCPLITHVPFIWAEPGNRAGRRTNILAGTLDIAPTILDRANVEPYNGIQGVSLVSVLEDTNSTIARDSMVIEDDQQRAVFGLPSGSRLRTLITQRWRMTIAQDDSYGELYDLQSDPHEMENLFEDSTHRSVRAELMEKLAYRQMGFPTAAPCQSAEPKTSLPAGSTSASVSICCAA